METLTYKKVDFGGKRVWPNGPNSVTVTKQTVTLTPAIPERDLTITIDINDELADYYFGERPWDPIDRWVFKDSFKTRFAGYTYLVKAKFSGGLEVSGLFKVAEQSEFDKAVRTGKKAKAIVSEVIRAKKAPNDKRDTHSP